MCQRFLFACQRLSSFFVLFIDPEFCLISHRGLQSDVLFYYDFVMSKINHLNWNCNTTGQNYKDFSFGSIAAKSNPTGKCIQAFIYFIYLCLQQVSNSLIVSHLVNIDSILRVKYVGVLFYLSLVRSTYRITFNGFRYRRKVTQNPVNTWTVYNNYGRFTCHVFCFNMIFACSIWLNLRSKLDFWVVFKKAPTRKTTTSHLLRALQLIL